MSSTISSPIPRALYLSMLLQFAIGGSIFPFITILLRDRGLHYGDVSLIFLAASSTLLIFPFLWGMLADRYIRIQRLFTLLNLFTIVSLAAFAGQTGFWGLLITFMLFQAFFHPTLTLINPLCFHYLANPREQFARLRAWGSIGWIIPALPMFAWFAWRENGSADFVIYLGIVLACGMVAVSLFLPATPHDVQSSEVKMRRKQAYWPALKKLMRDGNYLTLLGSMFLVAASFSLLVFYSPPLLEELGMPRRWIGPVQCIGVVFEIILFRYLPRMILRWDYSGCMLLGCLALAARHLLFVYSDDPWILSASYILVGVVIVCYTTGVSLLVNVIAAVEVRATAQTLLVFFGSGLGPMTANWLAGKLAMRAGDSLQPVFAFAAILAALASLLILIRAAKLNRGGDGLAAQSS
jgi:MFS family permease